MEPFEVSILGCGSAKPTRRHLPSAQVVNVRGKYFLVDCGEGAQRQMQLMSLNMARVTRVFISHNHGDHVFGLPGLLSTMALLGRTADIHVHGPEPLGAYVDCVRRLYCEGAACHIVFHPVNAREHYIVYEDRSVAVWSLPLRHRVPCCGYLFREKSGLPHIRREMVDALGIPLSQINNIKAGASWTAPDGTVVPHERLTRPAEPGRSYAYCSDTSPQPALDDMTRGVTLLYHEATYPDELAPRAAETGHSTASQAAGAALRAGARKLCIGHYSARVRDEEALLAQARAVFHDTMLANEGLRIKL